jgi:hypothetical protein
MQHFHPQNNAKQNNWHRFLLSYFKALMMMENGSSARIVAFLQRFFVFLPSFMIHKM